MEASARRCMYEREKLSCLFMHGRCFGLLSGKRFSGTSVTNKMPGSAFLRDVLTRRSSTFIKQWQCRSRKAKTGGDQLLPQDHSPFFIRVDPFHKPDANSWNLISPPLPRLKIRLPCIISLLAEHMNLLFPR